jgi:hypothetical protein
MTDTRPIKSGFDRLIISVLVAIGLVLLVIAFTRCNPKARQCRKAEAKLADAIHLCPEIMLPQIKTDTIVLYTKPEAGAGERRYSQASVDSLATICAVLLCNNVDTVEIIRRIVLNACAFDTINVVDSALVLRIWSQNGRVRYWYNVLPQKVQAVVTTPIRTIATKPCPPVSRVKSWAWLWSIPAFCGGLFLGLFFKGSHRHE